MDKREIEEILLKYEVLQKGHFLLTSGLHSEFYFEKSKILQYPPLVERFSSLIKERFENEGIELVVGPTTGGVIIAYEVARQLSCRCAYAERKDNGRVIRKGFKIEEGERVLIVDDVLTTGGSIRETIRALGEWKVGLVGIGVFIDRSQKSPEFGVPHFAVYRREIENYPPTLCPLCEAGIALLTPGRGR